MQFSNWNDFDDETKQFYKRFFVLAIIGAIMAIPAVIVLIFY